MMLRSLVPCEDVGETREEAEKNLAKYGWRIVYNLDWHDGVQVRRGIRLYDIEKDYSQC
jgi:hypothetical protein